MLTMNDIADRLERIRLATVWCPLDVFVAQGTPVRLWPCRRRLNQWAARAARRLGARHFAR